MKTILSIIAFLVFSGNLLFAQINITFTTVNATCNGTCNGSSTVNISGGTPNYNIVWSNLTTAQVITGVCAGTYTVTVTDATALTATGTVTITEPTALTATTTSTNATCNGMCNGTASVTIGGGIPPYTYLWSDNQVTPNITNLCAGSYTVTIVDVNGCTTTSSVIITEPNAITLTTSQTDATCLNNDGEIQITSVIGGSPNYLYNWSVPCNYILTGSGITNLCAGVYNLILYDSNGCTATTSVTINQSSLPAELTGIVSYSGGNLPSGDGIVNLFLESTSGGGQYDSIGSQTLSGTGYYFNNLMPGNYHISVVLTNPSAYPNLFNTYYNNHFLWTDADTITLACNDSVSIPILMYEVVSLPNGNCDITGTIVYGNYSGFKSTKAVGEPVPGAEILIEQEPNDVPIQSTITDLNGIYTLQNIPIGSNYKLLVDIPGYPIMSTFLNITVNSTDTLLTNFNFLLDTTAGGGVYIDTLTGIPNGFLNSGITFLNVFPNPVSKYLNVNFELSQKTNFTIDLINVNGTITNKLIDIKECEKGSYKYKISMPQNFPEGNYLIKIQAGNSVIVKKLILKK